jgi:hypothetical protein
MYMGCEYPSFSAATSTTPGINRMKNHTWSLPHVMGPLFADLLILLQKNRTNLFTNTTTSLSSAASLSSPVNYRAPLYPTEFMDCELHQ